MAWREEWLFCVTLGPNRALTLEWSDDSFAGSEAKVSGLVVGPSTPLHHMWLKSVFVHGKVLVGVRERLPVDGVDVVPGNNSAGSVVVPQCQKVDNLLLEEAEGEPLVAPGLEGDVPSLCCNQGNKGSLGGRRK